MISLLIQSPSDADQRIDKFLRKYLPNAPLGAIFKWLRTGKVKVNGRKVEQNYRVLLEDIIELYFSEEELQSMQLTQISPKNPGGNIGISNIISIKESVIFEDEYLLVINKPAGMNVHPGDHKSTEVSLIELVQDYLGEKYNSLSFKPSLVHRIDRDTSGCILIAKEKRALEELLSQLQSGKIEKVYHAIVFGIPEKRTGTIQEKLLRIENAKNEAKVRVDENGLSAVTHYRVVHEIKNKYSLLECRIETGRTHQIRVHCSFIGHPLLGDKAYGNMKENSFIRREYGITRQLLHAYSLAFHHPINKKSLTIIAPYHVDFQSMIK